MKVAVLGSGIIGISSAWWLSQAGHDVVVIDRCTGPAQETSLANGAQISVSYAEPWANPQAPFKLLKWMFQEDAPLLFRPQLDWRQWMWGLAFLRSACPAGWRPTSAPWSAWPNTAAPRCAPCAPTWASSTTIWSAAS